MMCPEVKKALDSINLNCKPQSGKAKEVNRKEIADYLLRIIIEGMEAARERKMKWTSK